MRRAPESTAPQLFGLAINLTERRDQPCFVSTEELVRRTREVIAPSRPSAGHFIKFAVSLQTTGDDRISFAALDEEWGRYPQLSWWGGPAPLEADWPTDRESVFSPVLTLSLTEVAGAIGNSDRNHWQGRLGGGLPEVGHLSLFLDAQAVTERRCDSHRLIWSTTSPQNKLIYGPAEIPETVDVVTPRMTLTFPLSMYAEKDPLDGASWIQWHETIGDLAGLSYVYGYPRTPSPDDSANGDTAQTQIPILSLIPPANLGLPRVGIEVWAEPRDLEAQRFDRTSVSYFELHPTRTRTLTNHSPDVLPG